MLSVYSVCENVTQHAASLHYKSNIIHHEKGNLAKNHPLRHHDIDGDSDHPRHHLVHRPDGVKQAGGYAEKHILRLVKECLKNVNNVCIIVVGCEIVFLPERN